MMSISQSGPQAKSSTEPQDSKVSGPGWFLVAIGFGALMFLTHDVFGEVSLICRWAVSGYPHTGPKPNPWGCVMHFVVVSWSIISTDYYQLEPCHINLHVQYCKLLNNCLSLSPSNKHPSYWPKFRISTSPWISLPPLLPGQWSVFIKYTVWLILCSAAVIIALGVGVLLSRYNWTSNLFWWLIGSGGAALLYFAPRYLSFIGGLMLGVYTMSHLASHDWQTVFAVLWRVHSL